MIKLKKIYETPVIEIEEYELENTLGNLCCSSGGINPKGNGNHLGGGNHGRGGHK